MARDRYPTVKASRVTLKVINPDLHGRPPPPPEHKAWRMPEPQGLGDWVETWAKPIARWIDRQRAKHPLLRAALAKSGLVPLNGKLAGCSACSRRRILFNRWVPNARDWRSWIGIFRALARAVQTVIRWPASRRS